MPSNVDDAKSLIVLIAPSYYNVFMLLECQQMLHYQNKGAFLFPSGIFLSKTIPHHSVELDRLTHVAIIYEKDEATFF